MKALLAQSYFPKTAWPPPFGLGDSVGRYKEDHRYADSLGRDRSWQDELSIWWRLAITARCCWKKKFSQKQPITFTANLQTSLIGMEAQVLEHTFWPVPCERRVMM